MSLNAATAVAENTGGSTVLTEGSPPPAANGNAAPKDGAAAAIQAAMDGPPEYIPAKFWDPERKAPRIEELGKGYLSLERLLSREKIPVPANDDDVEGWERAYSALGRPEAPDKYEFERPTLPKELPYDEDAEKAFRQWAYQNGLNRRQAKNLYEAYVKTQVERHTQYEQYRQQARAQAEAAMQRKYGDQFQAKVQKAKAALQKYADPDYVKWLDESGQGNDPRVIEAWIRVGEEMAGDERLKGQVEQQVSPEDIEKAIADFRARHMKVLMDRDHPDHQSRLREYTRLFEQAYGSRPVA